MIDHPTPEALRLAEDYLEDARAAALPERCCHIAACLALLLPHGGTIPLHRLAWECQSPQPEVRYAIRRLEEAGLLTTLRTRGRATTYLPLMP